MASEIFKRVGWNVGTLERWSLLGHCWGALLGGTAWGGLLGGEGSAKAEGAEARNTPAVTFFISRLEVREQPRHPGNGSSAPSAPSAASWLLLAAAAGGIRAVGCVLSEPALLPKASSLII
ncbi:hypothetical protein AOQ84DRAFT_369046 [Glonium stellatum]|uniref:Uncharacterized protein n=1 Tax=Glonium stellatum TaxID=574774 RepID=A0A8E2EQT7_9PEZI|nr:hypothetical protein AOQ84DRAFT_369046 [Glonium stellatum]